jgi:TolB-like protein
MLTGSHPWRRPSAVDVLHAIAHDDPPPIGPPHPSVGLAAILPTLLRKNPAERYASAEAVLEAIETPYTGHAPSAGDRWSRPAVTSIAILPFVLLGEVEDGRALSLGFADALITVLSNLEDVIVAPTSTILKYHHGVEPAEVCRDLGVRQTLQGTVQKLGDDWRVSIQLFDAATARILVSEKYDFMRLNLFDVQDEVARRVVESLHSRFQLAPGRSRDRYSSDPEAYDAYMAGLRESYADQLQPLQIAAEHLSRAVERDPGFALAHATLSLVCMNIYFQFAPQREWLRQAEDHCGRALTLDPELPEGHLARAWILWSPAKNFQHAEAIASLERVLTARPNLERAHNRMATICQHIGRLREARLAHERALRSNPRTRTSNLEDYYLFSGDFARAEEAAEAWFRERPGNMYAIHERVLPPLLRGDLDRAEHCLSLVPREISDEPLVVSVQGMVHARRGRADAALACARRSLESPASYGHTHHVHYQVACIYAVLGDRDTAMAWLERAADSGFPCWPFYLKDPHLESLREEPAFKRLIADLEQTYSTLRITCYEQ